MAFYDDQATHHAAALTYYGLMSLFPTLLLAVSLLGLIGEYPGTYNSIISHLRDVVPHTILAPLDDGLRAALRSKGTAVAALVVGTVTALYGTTGYLEAARRALNVVFEARDGRSFVRRKVTDILSTFVFLAL
ncbi:MAG: rane protein, partial [Thermoleophilaceae bacterium]|nr:rane protein [Thermoleophilaceae bacterium]